MARPTGRVLTLLELLQSGGTRTMAELADRLGVDGRTVRRYVDHLIDLDVPVESVRGRYGGYRLAPGYRLPPLMLSDDEALAVLLGLVAGRRAGLPTATGTAGETAAAKIRRVLPERLGRPAGRPARSRSPSPRRPGRARRAAGPAVLLTDRRRGAPPPAGLDPVHRPATAGSERTLHPYGLVCHAGRWYVTGADPGAGRTGPSASTASPTRGPCPGRSSRPPGSTRPSACSPASPGAPYRHEVTLRIQRDASSRSAPGCPPASRPWTRTRTRAGGGSRYGRSARLAAPLLAALDLPFVIERPDELRDLVAPSPGASRRAPAGSRPLRIARVAARS